MTNKEVKDAYSSARTAYTAAALNARIAYVAALAVHNTSDRNTAAAGIIRRDHLIAKDAASDARAVYIAARDALAAIKN